MPTEVTVRRDGIVMHRHHLGGETMTRWHGPWERHGTASNTVLIHEREAAYNPVNALALLGGHTDQYRDSLNGTNAIGGSWSQYRSRQATGRAGRVISTHTPSGFTYRESRPIPMPGQPYVAPRQPQPSYVTEASEPDIQIHVTDRRFGVELECLGDKAAIKAAMEARGVAVYMSGYNHANSETSWKITTDGSLRNTSNRPERRGSNIDTMEIVSPILHGDEGLAQLKLVTEALRECNAFVNVTCGTHVHHDASRDFNKQKLYNLLVNYKNAQKAINKLVSASRRNDAQYCHLITDRDLEVMLPSNNQHRSMSDMVNQTTRYKTLNLAAYSRHKTVEFRQHQGTVEYNKIAAWVQFGQYLIAYSNAGNTLPRTENLTVVFEAIGLPAEARQFFYTRATSFGFQTETPVEAN